VNLGEKRAGEHNAEVVVHDAIERTDVERPHLDVSEALRGQRAPKLVQQTARERSAA
jgi:hypothetical protein